MKALSLKQPWLNLILSGAKTIETRAWATPYRGPLLLCASQRVDPDAAVLWPETESAPYLQGYALCTVDLVDCRPMTVLDEVRAQCDWTPGRVAWMIENVRRCEPWKVKGQLGLFQVPDWQITFPLGKIKGAR